MLALLVALVQSPTETREERVMELIRTLKREGSWHYSRAFFETGPAPIGGRSIVTAIASDTFCGNSDEGRIDGERVRRLALELGALYGLALEPDRSVGDRDGLAVLDGLDPAAKIGFELRGRADLDDGLGPLAEEGQAALEEHELVVLEQLGYRVFVADLAGFRKLDGDAFTATLACLAGYVAFLDEVTEGEDIELGGLLFEREATWDFMAAKSELPSGVRLEDRGHERALVVDQSTRVLVHCRGRADFGPPIGPGLLDLAERGDWGTRRELPESTRGAPSVLNFRAAAVGPDGQPGPWFRLRVRQRRGQTELVHESDRLTAFLPSAFDLAQPFEVELELSPGHYTFWGPARIGAAAPASPSLRGRQPTGR